MSYFRNHSRGETMTYKDTATYECVNLHRWETTEGRFSPFKSRPCPVCKCASVLLNVSSCLVNN